MEAPGIFVILNKTSLLRIVVTAAASAVAASVASG